MTNQPLKGIMETGDWSNGKTFRVACECHDPDHDINAWIEIDPDKDTKEITLGFYVYTETPFWKKGFSRIKTAWTVLSKGYHRSEHHLILDKQAALNFSDAIKNSIDHLENHTTPRS
jgi:hypothetical protein